jgi:hypothetical protein
MTKSANAKYQTSRGQSLITPGMPMSNQPMIKGFVDALLPEARWKMLCWLRDMTRYYCVSEFLCFVLLWT